MSYLDVHIYESMRDALWIPIENILVSRGFQFKYVYIHTNVEKAYSRIK